MSTGWNEKIRAYPGASFLQTTHWAVVKGQIGWDSQQVTWESGCALVLEKPIRLGPLPTGFCFHYVPRGPLTHWENPAERDAALKAVREHGKSRNALFVKIDPEIPLSFGEPGTEEFIENPAGQELLKAYREQGWVYSPQQIQFENTVWIDLEPDEETLLANMKQRTRYKVRLAEKKGVAVRMGTPADFEMLTEMYQETSARDGFLIRPPEYYMDVWNRYYEDGILFPLIAEVEGEAVAAVMIFIVGETARYVYGMSRDLHREKMPNYLLQWEAIRLAKAKGCKIYDLWGAPDTFDESDRMWGVYQFKRGLGGRVVITPGAYDLPLKPLLYKWFIHTLPKIVSVLQRRNHNSERKA